jgi:hypothetical protein
MAEKYFKREEAENLLPLIVDCLERARSLKGEIETLDQEMARAAARIMVLGGTIAPTGDLLAVKSRRESFLSQVQDEIQRIQQTGGVVKDLDEGLVDFPALVEGEEVFLCWKLGEERIRYWHGLEEGFAGRKPLEDEAGDEETPPPSSHLH